MFEISTPDTAEEWTAFWAGKAFPVVPADLELARRIRSKLLTPGLRHHIACSILEKEGQDIPVGYEIITVDLLGKIVNGYMSYGIQTAHRSFAPSSAEQIQVVAEVKTHILQKPTSEILLEGDIQLYFSNDSRLVQSLEEAFTVKVPEPKPFLPQDRIMYI
jgi:hypothetical protein